MAEMWGSGQEREYRVSCSTYAGVKSPMFNFNFFAGACYDGARAEFSAKVCGATKATLTFR